MTDPNSRSDSPMLDRMADMDGEAPRIRQLIARQHERMPGRPFDIVRLCDDIDSIDVEFSWDLPDDISGKIEKNGENYLIRVNAFEPKPRQRFTAAHELAHYVLHRDVLDKRGYLPRDKAARAEFSENILLRGGLPNRLEAEANHLASEILMPYSAIEEYMASRDEFTVKMMARQFNVSPSAIAIRLGVPID